MCAFFMGLQCRYSEFCFMEINTRVRMSQS